jgi:tetratricopeptide (TPR) repeat protein
VPRNTSALGPARAKIFVWMVIASAGCHAPAGEPDGKSLDQSGRVLMSLEQIPLPPPPTAPVRPTTGPVPDEAIEAYLDGRSKLHANQPRAASDAFARAAALDPTSEAVQFDLGRAEEQAGNRERAIAAFDRAAAIDPAAVAPLLAAGRLLQQQGRADAAIDRLHRALKSPELAEDGQGAAVHLWLGRALGSAGYLSASVGQLKLVIARLNDATSDLRNDPSILEVLRRPVILDLDQADLLEGQQLYEPAAQLLGRAADLEPGDVELISRLVTDLFRLDRGPEAVDRASALVVADHAGPDSVAVLTRACAAVDPPRDPADVLLQLANNDPHDPSLQSAAVDALVTAGRRADAVAFCRRARSADPADVAAVELLAKLVLDEPGGSAEAARAVIQTAAADPDAVDRLAPLWSAAMQSAAAPAPAEIAAWAVPAGARDWYLSQRFDAQRRKGESAAALVRAVTDRPPFAPAYRDALDRIWADSRQTSQWKLDRSGQLTRSAESAGDPALASELRGRSDARAGRSSDAALAFAAAMQMNPKSATVRLQAALVAGSPAQVESDLWQVAADFPTFAGTYHALESIYLADKSNPQEPIQRLAVLWRANLPADIRGRLLEARLAVNRGDDAGAEKLLAALIDESPDDPAEFDAARAFYSRVGRLDDLARRLQTRLDSRPGEVALVAEVVTLFTSMHRAAEAVRVLDAARAVLAGDPIALYPLANLYAKAGEPAAATDVLREVLRSEPDFAAACNDLAFYLIDAGTDLPAAGDLVQRALKMEPDNPAFLDSLGWLQFKRGDFAASVATLRQAAGPAVGGEAVVLDHLGDALAKTGQPEQAREAWSRALARVATTPDDQPTLRLQLLQKLKATTRPEP